MLFTEESILTQRFADQESLTFRFPDVHADLDQDEEWVELLMDGDWHRLRLHDYGRIYDVPGLYEALFYRTLRCCSPRWCVQVFADVLTQHRQPADALRVFDVGAGNGMVGEQMWNLGAECLVGIDIIEEARQAALRDRTHVYVDYLVEDLTHLPEDVERRIRHHRLNCMTCVAALGYGDIPAAAFLKALDLLETPAWLAFNIKEDFLYEADRTGFGRLIDELRADRIIRLEAYRRYRHRLSISGKPLHYVAMVARKVRELDDEWTSL